MADMPIEFRKDILLAYEYDKKQAEIRKKEIAEFDAETRGRLDRMPALKKEKRKALRHKKKALQVGQVVESPALPLENVLASLAF